MGKYHNKLDRKYFKNSIYVKRFEKEFNIKIKDYPLQYDILFDTYNTFIIINNNFFSTNYMKYEDRINKSISTLKAFLTEYKNKHKRSYDSNCLIMYDKFEYMLEQLEEILNVYEKRKSQKDTITLKSLCSNFEKELEEYMSYLNLVNFDYLVDSKEMPFNKVPNDKLPRKVNCKIVYGLEWRQNILFNTDKQEELNNQFIRDYEKKTSINLNNDEKQKEFIFLIHCIIKDINNAIVDYYNYNNKTILDLTINNLSNTFFKQDISFVEDIRYKTLFNNLVVICEDIKNNNIDIAFDKIKDLMLDYKELYEFMS